MRFHQVEKTTHARAIVWRKLVERLSEFSYFVCSPPPPMLTAFISWNIEAEVGHFSLIISFLGIVHELNVLDRPL